MTIYSLALLDGYKVRWSRETVVRDIVQNFFDEVVDFKEVEVDIQAGDRIVEVRGPSHFSLDYLRYIGATTKGDPAGRTAGSFGEGFKICALVLLRDYGVTVTAGSGTWEIRPFLRPMRLGRELCYEVRESAGVKGSFVRLEEVDQGLLEAFGRARDFFRHPDNPRLSRPLHVDEEAGIGVYIAKDAHRGDLFYRRQHRGSLRFSRGAGLTFAYDDRLEPLEADRDRRNIRAAEPLVAAMARLLPDEMLERLIHHLRVYWQGGNTLLRVLLGETKRRHITMAFPKRWLARVRLNYFLEEHAKKIGYHLGIEALSNVGMPTVVERLGHQTSPRAPTAVERARMELAKGIYHDLVGSPPLYGRFRVVDVLNENRHMDYGGRHCTLSSKSLAGPIEDGLVDCLWALALGRGKREASNSDRLTRLLAGALRQPDLLARHGEAWREASLEVQEAEDEDILDDSFYNHIPVAIMAPEGYPPADDIRRTIIDLGRELSIPLRVQMMAVNDIRDAAAHYVRGVASVFVASEEVEPRKGSTMAFAPRFFGPEGASLVPTRESLRAVLERVWRSRKEGRRRRFLFYAGPPRSRQNRSYMSYLAKHDPPEWERLERQKALSQAYHEVYDGLPSSWIHDLHSLLLSVARQEMAGELFDRERLREQARAACGRAREEIRGLLRALEARAPALLGKDDVGQMALRWVVGRAIQAAERGVAMGQVTQEALGMAESLLILARTAWQAPLDRTCLEACAQTARAVFGRVLAEDGPERALERATETLDGAIQLALKRHGQTDEHGDPVDCWGISESLKELLPPDQRLGRPAEPSPVSQAVRRAWEETKASGATDEQAAGACLEAATVASAQTDRSPGGSDGPPLIKG